MLQHILRSDQRQHHFIQHVDHRLLLLLLVLGLFPWAAPVVADGGLTVNSVADAPDWRPGDGRCETAPSNGVCTLRAAIQEANALAGRDSIRFNLPGTGVQRIVLATALPPITAPVMLDGGTQPGASCATWSLKLELDGRTISGPAQGLVLRGGGSTVRGLVLNGFTTAINLDTLGGNTVQCNAIGSDATGTLDRVKADSAAGLVGILLNGSAGNLIGGSEPGQGNRITFPTGIYLDSSNANRIQGNKLTGLADSQANGNHGIVLANDASRNRIGGLAHGEANLISNFGGAGVTV
ncbi:MAG: CSLREA domain-containing protein, partial [Chloroflexales bacterium]